MTSHQSGRIEQHWNDPHLHLVSANSTGKKTENTSGGTKTGRIHHSLSTGSPSTLPVTQQVKNTQPSLLPVKQDIQPPSGPLSRTESPVPPIISNPAVSGEYVAQGLGELLGWPSSLPDNQYKQICKKLQVALIEPLQNGKLPGMIYIYIYIYIY